MSTGSKQNQQPYYDAILYANLHTLALRGYHGYILDLQLSNLRNLRWVKLLDVEIRGQNSPSGITELDITNTKELRYARRLGGIFSCTDLTTIEFMDTMQ